MSLNLSTELEARIVAKAQQLGLPVGDLLELVLSENEAISGSVRRAESAAAPLSPEEVQGKISRGLAQLKDCDLVDGEQFMSALLAGMDERRAG